MARRFALTVLALVLLAGAISVAQTVSGIQTVPARGNPSIVTTVVGRTITNDFIAAAEWTETRVRFLARRIGQVVEFLEYNGEAGVLELNSGPNAFYTAFGGVEMQPSTDRSVRIGRVTKRFNGLQLSTAALGTCDADNAGLITALDGSAGVAGSLHVCLKNADGSFAWKQIAIGS
jgi:hypothetical protein